MCQCTSDADRIDAAVKAVEAAKTPDAVVTKLNAEINRVVPRFLSLVLVALLVVSVAARVCAKA